MKIRKILYGLASATILSSVLIGFNDFNNSNQNYNENKVYAANEVNLIIPSSFKMTFNSDGTNTVDTLKFINSSSVPVTINNINATAINDWNLVTSSSFNASNKINSKNIVLSLFTGEELKSGDNNVSHHIAAGGNLQTTPTVKRSAFKQAVYIQKALDLVFTYDIGQSNFNAAFDSNGGSAINTITKKNGETFTIPAAPTKDGYKFSNWTGSDGKTYKTGDIATMPIGGISFKANWTANNYTYNIKYVSSTGIALGTSTITKAFGTTNTVSAPAKTGYTTPNSQTVKFDSTSTKTITFTYTPITYTISYKLNSGSNPTNQKTSYTIETATFTLPTPTRNGYIFTGWTGNNGNTPQTSVSITKGSTGNKSYTANWSLATYSITYNLDGGSITGQKTSYTINTYSFTLPTPTRPGYSFTGWTGTGLSSATKTVTITQGSTGNRTYTANWSANTYIYNIKYVSSSGVSLGTSTVSGTFGSTKSVYPVAKTGYTAPSAQNVIFDSTTAKNITFTYTPISYSITYTLNNGLITGQKTSYNIETSSFTLPTPTRSGYIFTGWTGSNGTTAQKTVTVAKGSTGNKSYTANWQQNITYTITLHGNGTWSDGTSINNKVLTFSSQSAVAANISSITKPYGYSNPTFFYEDSSNNVKDTKSISYNSANFTVI